MNGRSMAVLVLALICGLGAMIVVNRMLAPPAADAVEEVEILAAARDLGFQEVLNKPELVKTIKVPRSAAPAGSFRSYPDVADRWVTIKMLADEPILDGKLAQRDAPRGITAVIPPGMRAVGVEVNEQSGVSGFIQPQSHVDVILAVTSTSPGRTGLPEAITILQDVLVLASGQNISQVDDKAANVRTVTLALTPEQIETITAARTRGPLSLALRPINDHAIEPARPQPVEEVTILVAARDLEPGRELLEAMVRPATLPKDQVPPGAFKAFKEITDRWLQQKVAADRPIVADQLAPLDLKSRIAAGMRAVSIEVDERTGVAGFVKPDDRVDVIREVKDEGQGQGQGKGGKKAETLLRDVRVLAIGQTFTASPDGAAVISKSVTVELTPNQVETLNSAHLDGRLALALRGANEERARPMAHVVVATRDLAVGTTVAAAMVTLEEIPADQVPPEALIAVGEAVGRQVRRAIAASTPLVADQFAKAADCARIRDGFRGVTVRADEHAGPIQPCDHVDVLWTDGRQATGRGDEAALNGLLLENVHIGEVRPADPKDPKAGHLLVLEVPADRVAAVALAARAGGTPTIVRRGPGDVRSLVPARPPRQVALQGAVYHGPKALESFEVIGRSIGRRIEISPAPIVVGPADESRPCCRGENPGQIAGHRP